VSRTDRVSIALVGAALALAAAAGYALLEPPDSSRALEPTNPMLFEPGPSAEAPTQNDTIVVDVQGAVVEPGIHALAGGSRIADAIDAAGGFASDADLDAASDLNLAQPLVDGQQVRVPRLGDSSGMAPSSNGEPRDGVASGPLNVNTATPEELEALPGIGPVTVQRIIAARQQQPFSSLQDLVDRGIIHRGQLEDIADLATAG